MQCKGKQPLIRAPIGTVEPQAIIVSIESPPWLPTEGGPDGPAAAGMGEGVVRLATDWAAAGCGGVADADEALLAPCIISSAISVTGSFSGTFGADSVSWEVKIDC